MNTQVKWINSSKRLWLMMFLMTVLIMMISGPVWASSDLTGRQLMLKVDERPDGDNRKTVSRMTLINKRGRERVRLMVTYAKDYGKDSKSLFYFKKPADVKGTGFLTFDYDEPGKDDDRWLFLPALKKVRRISGSSKNDYFMGSDFTYDDMGGRSVDEDNHMITGEEVIDGRQCWIVVSTPKEKDYLYSSVKRWIAKDSLVQIKGEYFDRKNDLIKTLTITDLRQHQGFWTIYRMEMNNSQENHKTVISIDEVQYNLGVKDSLFRVSTLEKGRIR
ncbi:MAG: outer membrane lipoprotein-sorting protein [Proteobacteria bacterium]|nr:outer membrane lipoprotein-sorting protein [Pseudomonadota bacterium]